MVTTKPEIQAIPNSRKIIYKNNGSVSIVNDINK